MVELGFELEVLWLQTQLLSHSFFVSLWDIQPPSFRGVPARSCDRVSRIQNWKSINLGRTQAYWMGCATIWLVALCNARKLSEFQFTSFRGGTGLDGVYTCTALYPWMLTNSSYSIQSSWGPDVPLADWTPPWDCQGGWRKADTLGDGWTYQPLLEKWRAQCGSGCVLPWGGQGGLG
jgi:hypothetical protein